MTVVALVLWVAAVAALLVLGAVVAKLPQRLLRRGFLGSLGVLVLSLGLAVFPSSVSAPAPARVALVVVLILAVVGTLICLVGLLSTRRSPVREVDAWAQAHGVEVTAHNAPFLAAYVHEGHRVRLVCGFGAWIVAPAVTAATGIDLGLPGIVWLLFGYLVGCVWSEAWLTRVPGNAERVASLVPRRLQDYLPARMRLAPAALSVVAVGLAGLAVAMTTPSQAATEAGELRLDLSVTQLRGTVVALGCAMPVLAALVWGLQRHIVGKPQPVVEASLLRADDAVRAAAVRLLGSTATAIGLSFVGIQLLMLGSLVAGRGAAVFAFGFLLCVVLAFLSWRFDGHRGTVVRRSNPLVAP